MAEYEQTVAVTVHIPVALFEQLKRLALHDLRPMKDELIVLLQEAVNGRREP
jgi:hypothetical protein